MKYLGKNPIWVVLGVFAALAAAALLRNRNRGRMWTSQPSHTAQQTGQNNRGRRRPLKIPWAIVWWLPVISLLAHVPIAILIFSWDEYTDRLADFLKWPGTNADGGLVQLLLLVAALFALSGIAALYSQIKQAEKDRNGQILTDLSQRWDELQVIDCRKRIAMFPRDGQDLCTYLQAIKGDARSEFLDMMIVANFFEDLGILVAEDILPTKLVAKSLASPARIAFERYRPFIDSQREAEGNPEYYNWFQELVATMSVAQ